MQFFQLHLVLAPQTVEKHRRKTGLLCYFFSICLNSMDCQTGIYRGEMLFLIPIQTSGIKAIRDITAQIYFILFLRRKLNITLPVFDSQDLIKCNSS